MVGPIQTSCIKNFVNANNETGNGNNYIFFVRVVTVVSGFTLLYVGFSVCEMGNQVENHKFAAHGEESMSSYREYQGPL